MNLPTRALPPARRTDSPSRRQRAALAALAFGATLFAIPLASPSPANAVGPLPECRLADILTVPRDYDSWSITLVDWLLRVEDDYVPPDLVPVSEAGIDGPGLIRAVAIDDLAAMTAAAAAAGTPIAVNSPYRSYAEQVASFNGWVAIDGYDIASTYSQRPGHSEHQLGLTIDFMTQGGGSALQGDWATTPSGAWMAEHAWEYGWVMSYPKGTDGSYEWNEQACFHYEPWHYRYLGREMAARVHESGLTIREYLWTNFTMVDPITGEPIPTPTPTPTPSPTASPTPTVAPTASPTATASRASVSPDASPSPDANWLGMDPPIAIAVFAVIGLLVLAPIAVAARRGSLRR